MSDAVTIRVARGQVKGSFAITLHEGDPVAAAGAELARANGVKPPKAAPIQQALRELTGDVKNIGSDLGKFLFAGDVAKAWTERSRNAISLRTYVDLGDSGLDGLPWEMTLFEGTSVFLRATDPVVIFRAGRKGSDPNPESEIRVLVAVVAKDEDGALGCEAEARGIRTAIRELNRVLDVRIERHPSRQRLTEVVGKYQPHVVHLTGHGDDDGVQLYDGANTTAWGATEASNDVNGWAWKPDLIYLNTCRGAAAGLSEKGAQIQADLVSRLLQERVPAVVAMRADVRGQVAREGAEEFYRQLARGAAVDVTIAAARARMARVAPGREADFSPYLPHLVVARPVETILRHTALVDLADPCETIDTTLQTFVGRDNERWEMLQLLEDGVRCAIVKGSGEVGKSWLLQWCMDGWLRRKFQVRYVQIAGLKTWLDVIRAIRDGNPALTGSIHRAMQPRASRILNMRLNALAQGVVDPPSAEPTGEVPEDSKRTSKLISPGEVVVDAHIRAMEALHDALQIEAGDGGLVIVLDSFALGDQGLPRGHFDTLFKYWIDEKVVRAPGPIRVILGLSSPRHIEEYGLTTLPEGFKPFELQTFSNNEFNDLALELVPLRFASDLDTLGNDRIKALNFLGRLLSGMDAKAFENEFTGGALQRFSLLAWKFCVAQRMRW